MGALKDLNPKSVFHFFEEMTKIPHGSGNEKQISDYLVNFAKERGFEVIQDKALNVVIKKPGTRGYENSAPVIIQGHMDMVCEKLKNCEHDFTKDPLKLRIDGDFVYATGTTLGADDGMAIAFGLAVLDSKELEHPPIELLCTTNEETGMDGAFSFDVSNLSGKTLLNIDGEEEGVFLVSCAGGVTTLTSINTEWEKSNKETVEIEILGLNGGHSGMEICKQRGNANKLMGRLLNEISKEIEFNLVKIDGGSKHNAIPRECRAFLNIDKTDSEKLENICKNIEQDLKNEYRVEDKNVQVLVQNSKQEERQLSKKVTNDIITFLLLIPDGVQSVSKDIEGLIETSLNLGILETKENAIEFTSAIRSAVKSKKFEIADKIEVLSRTIGANFKKDPGYPEWQYEPNSNIREKCVKVYKEVVGVEPKIDAIHAGLECGLFKEKMADTDMISFGPQLYDVHTANEHCSISSVQKYWDFLTNLLKELK